MKARTYLILMPAAILVPTALIASAGLSRLLQTERDSRIRSVQETGRASPCMGATFTLRLPLAETPAAVAG